MKHTKELSNENEMNSLPNYANSEAPSERPNPEHIRYLAHRLWVERGCPEGSSESDWFEAERRLSGIARAAAT
jgi:hypothetical protein